jgi:hypothetical protein
MSRAEDRNQTGSDLKLAEFFLGADLQVNRNGDVDITSGEMNLAQAILHRIRTVKGELAELGHPDYGSLIFDFVGLENNWVTRQRLKLAIRDTLRQETRIKEIISVTVNPRTGIVPGTRDKGKKDARMLTTLLSDAGTDSELADPDELGFGGEALPGSSDLSNTIDVDIVIVPMGSAQPFQMGFPFNLEGV